MHKYFGIENLTLDIKSQAKNFGFMSCGISEARFLEEEAPKLEEWLNNNMNGKMSYMERNFDMRLDPRKIVDDAKSVISLTYNYFPKQTLSESGFKISKYAYGKDYHFVIKEKVGNINGRVFVDSAPILERAWAKNSGLGWVGKNTNLISKQNGSFFFLV